MMILVTGGSASGKSEFAEQCVLSFGERKRFYVATMIAWDEECRKRIQRHRAMRAKKNFDTIEQPVDLKQVAVPPGSAVLLECVSNLAANELFREMLGQGEELPADREEEEPSEASQESAFGKSAASVFSAEQKNEILPEEKRTESARQRILEGILSLKAQCGHLVVVTNEVFSDGEQYDAETENYRRLLGDINCRLAAMADEVYEVTLGIPMVLKKEKRGCTYDFTGGRSLSGKEGCGRTAAGENDGKMGPGNDGRRRL